MKVLAYTSPARGHLYPLVPTLLELRSRDHQVSVRSLSSEIDLLSNLGLAAAPISASVQAREMDDWRGRGQMDRLKRALTAFVDRAQDEVQDLTQAIREERPDLLLIDVNSWGAQAVAEASGLPWAVFAPYPLPIPSRDVPPFGLGLKPLGGPLGRLRDTVLNRVSMLGWNQVLPQYNRVRQSAHAAPLAGIVELFGRAPLILGYTAEPFEYPRSDWPASVRLVGPSTWAPPSQAPDWLHELKAPVVLVTTSTEYQADDTLVQVALDALAGEPMTVVATHPTGRLGSLRIPGNARVEQFVPHGPLLERTCCVVCHGGMGITQKALAAGVPVCVVPFGRDQPEVARRVEVAGAGTRLPAARLSPARLRLAVLGAIGLADGARRVAEAFRRAGGPEAAAGALEEVWRSRMGWEAPPSVQATEITHR